MDIWLIIDGSQTGPFSDYEIRSKLRSGELQPATPAWFQGQDGWHALSDIEVLREEVEDSWETAEPAIPGIEHAREVLDGGLFANRPPPLPQQPMVGRRFWARWFDLQCYMTVVWSLLAVCGTDLYAALKNPWIGIGMFVPWFLIEAVVVQRFGTTPGKALLGLRVVNQDGSGLTLGQSVWRSLRVLISGIGLGWDLLALLCQGMSWYFTRRMGRSMWDIAGGHRVVQTRDDTAWRVLVFVGGFFAALILRGIVLFSATEKLKAELLELLRQLFSGG